ncbi:MAG: methionyl-tRNA formyltransferase [Tannerellaceae bacterium]|jgi:methionyl-tRNA formyltransferase|nr:methionyl-tRNA formyltransferase [Tannerellaceae bacterium]
MSANRQPRERIVFMGTPDFAVESLRILVESGYNVVGVVTAPDRAVGKHHSRLTPSPVAAYASSCGLPLLQPDSLKDASFIEALRSWSPALQIVVAFRLLPRAIWELPPLGTFNLHASLLPQYRGAAPINRAIMNGETRTGVTTFFLTDGVDLGQIILQRPHPISDTDDAGTLHDSLMKLGAELVRETVDAILSGGARTISQASLYTSEAELIPAPKIFTDTCRIDWRLPVKQICNHIRGLSPCPAAWAELLQPDGSRHTLKIFQAEAVYVTHADNPGRIRIDGSGSFTIAASDGYIRPLLLQLSGKKRMSAEDFLRGQKQLAGSVVE